jgi:hypothetical protein
MYFIQNTSSAQEPKRNMKNVSFIANPEQIQEHNPTSTQLGTNNNEFTGYWPQNQAM